MTTRVTDDDLTNLMQALHAALSQALAAHDDVTLELLPEHQLYVSRRLVAGPQGGKAPRQVPAEDGFTLYIRLASGHGAGPPRQQSAQAVDLLVTDLATTTLKLDRVAFDRVALDQTWQLRGGAGLAIVITARCGSARVFDDVDRALAVLDAGLRQGLPRAGG